MYAPSSRSEASALRGHDPAVEAELHAWAHSHRDEEESAFASEERYELAEFLPVAAIDHERCEREWTRMEVEPNPNALYHDGREF